MDKGFDAVTQPRRMTETEVEGGMPEADDEPKLSHGACGPHSPDRS